MISDSMTAYKSFIHNFSIKVKNFYTEAAKEVFRKSYTKYCF